MFGALIVLVTTQVSVAGSYLPPVFKETDESLLPPQMIISVPVQACAQGPRAGGALVVVMESQVSDEGSYRPPVLNPPPHTSISFPVHTAT